MNYVIHNGSWHQTEINRFIDNEIVERNGKQYRLCFKCHKIVRVDGFFSGIHLCDKQDD